MKKIISARHTELEPRVRDQIRAHLERFEDRYHKLTSARVVVDRQKSRHSVGVFILGKNLDIEATAEDVVPEVAIQDALDKADRQLTKFLDRLHIRQGKSLGELEVEIARAEQAADPDDEELLFEAV